MAVPVAPARFAHPEDVAARFEGTFPTGKEEWAQLRIEDVEAVLVGLVPSLTGLITDADRLRRVKQLVVDKVLDMYRNPEGAATLTQAMDGVSETTSYGRDRSSASISFTQEELNRVRLRTRRRNLGMAKLAPWNPTSC